MNVPLNYWPLFTSVGFTVPFPPCFLTSITCPVLTYLPVHLFRASILYLSLALLSSSPKLSLWAQEGGLQWARRWEDREKLEKNRRDSGTAICLRVSVCASDSWARIWLCICLGICFCFARVHGSRKRTASTLARVIFTHCKDALTSTCMRKKHALWLSANGAQQSHVQELPRPSRNTCMTTVCVWKAVRDKGWGEWHVILRWEPGPLNTPILEGAHTVSINRNEKEKTQMNLNYLPCFISIWRPRASGTIFILPINA